MPSHSKNGAFQKMGLEGPLLKAIFACNYRLPTPIQRKIIPLIQNGRDVIALARTGSGKTAAFLIPLLNSLSRESSFEPSNGFGSVCAIIISPSREIARQTWQVARTLGKHLSIDVDLVTGGESMNDNFEQYSRRRVLPIVIVATLGRLVHILVEMSVASMDKARYLVLDEADRLFEEKTFCDQLKELLNCLPANRQTILLSATMPKVMTDFVRTGLVHQPVLCCLEKELTLSDNLKVVYLYSGREEKLENLCSLLRRKDLGQTCVFVSTHYAAEFIGEVVKNVLQLRPVVIYGNSRMDDVERGQAMKKFKNKKANLLITTDVAARGVDVPTLDTVINYNFPRIHKLFIHRAGRTARAGRSGTVISLVSADEMPYLYDLHDVLGQELKTDDISGDDNFMLGRPMPVDAVLKESLQSATEQFQSQYNSCQNAWKAYLRNSKPPSKLSIVKWKQNKKSIFCQLRLHPMFGKESCTDSEKQRFLNEINLWRCSHPISELSKSGFKSLKSAKAVKAAEKGSSKVLQDPEYFISYQSKSQDTPKFNEFNSDVMACSFDMNADDATNSKRYSRINKSIQNRKLVWDRQLKKFVSGQKIADQLAAKQGWMKGTVKSKYNEWLKSKRGNISGVKPVDEIVSKIEKKKNRKQFELQRRKTKLARRQKPKS